MIRLLLPRDARRATPGVAWAYLGKDVAIRQDLEAHLGAANALRTTERLQRLARKSRDEINDFIGRLGQCQRSPLHWWSTNLACRHPDNTDLFLLVVYLLVIGELVAEHPGGEMAIVIEDPWCYEEAASGHRGNTEVVALSSTRGARFVQAIRCLLRGILARAVLSATVAAEWAALRPRHEPPVRADESLVLACAYTHAVDAEGRIGDRFFGRIPERLADEHAVGMRYLAANHRSLRSVLHHENAGDDLELLCRFHRLGSVLRAFTTWPWIRQPALDVLFRGSPLRGLVRRERWRELSTTWSVESRLLFYAYRRLFSTRRGRTVVFYPCENLPWERALVLAARSNDTVRLIGYQHSSAPPLLVNLFPASVELASAPLPHALLTNSAISHQDLQPHWSSRVPMHLAGATRYTWLTDVERWTPPHRRESSDRLVFVALPIEKLAAREVLQALIAHQRVWRDHDVGFLIAPHPETPLQVVGYSERTLPPGFAPAVGFRTRLHEIDALLTCNTTLTLEGVAVGIPTLSFVPAGSLWLDAAPDHYPALVHLCRKDDIVESVLDALMPGSDHSADGEVVRPFAPVDPSVWRSVFSSMMYQ